MAAFICVIVYITLRCSLVVYGFVVDCYWLLLLLYGYFGYIYYYLCVYSYWIVFWIWIVGLRSVFIYLFTCILLRLYIAMPVAHITLLDVGLLRGPYVGLLLHYCDCIGWIIVWHCYLPCCYCWCDCCIHCIGLLDCIRYFHLLWLYICDLPCWPPHSLCPWIVITCSVAFPFSFCTPIVDSIRYSHTLLPHIPSAPPLLLTLPFGPLPFLVTLPCTFALLHCLDVHCCALMYTFSVAHDVFLCCPICSCTLLYCCSFVVVVVTLAFLVTLMCYLPCCLLYTHLRFIVVVLLFR